MNTNRIKSSINLLFAAAVTALLCSTSSNISAQTVLAGWNANGLTGSGPSPWAPATSNPNLTIGGLAKGPGITNTTTANVWGGNSWTNLGVPANYIQATNGGKYATFSLQPNAGYTVSITNISKLLYSHSATGPTNSLLEYSTNGTAFFSISNLYTTLNASFSSSNNNINLSGFPALQNMNSNTVATFRIVNWGGTSFAGTWYINPNGTTGNDLELQGVVTSAGVPPHITGISPMNVTANAGTTVAFTVSATGDPASYFWYKITGSTTNLIPSATTATLTLPNVLGADSASYFVILTNASGADTSSVVSLTVTGDPNIAVQPANTYGLLYGTAQFAVSAAGTSPGSQWYFADASGNIIAPVNNGPQSSGSVISGANTSTLTIAGLQPSNPTNFVVVVTNIYGSVTSSVASLLSVANTATLALWDFNGPEFTNSAVNPTCLYNPVPYLGVGSALAVGSCYAPGTSPLTATTTADPDDGLGFDQIIPGVDHLPNFSWITVNYPASGGNKQNGVQFNVSTVGAKNVKVSYESRVSPTASDYERLQYTTNGTDWIDYPRSSTFGGVAGTGAGGWLPFAGNTGYDLTGFPGVANNPGFGIRVVTEFQSTATYGIGTTNNYIGTANTYGTAGTVTYDLVTISGDAITNNNAPPAISSFTDTNLPDYTNVTLNFTVGDDTTPPDQLTYSAASLNSTVSPSFAFGGGGANRTLTIAPNSISDPVDAAPILVTVTDTNGDSTATWFLLTVTSLNLPPTNSLTSLPATNTLANTAITIPFTVGDDRTPVSGLTYSVASANNTVVPAANIVVNSAGTANPSVTITPATNQLGVGVVSVTVNDNDTQEPKSTTAKIAFMVRPNTNVIAIDCFDYDNSGALDSVSGGFWQHLSGIYGQMKVGSGTVTVDTLNNTENLQTPLLNAPYKTNSGGFLYYSYLINISDPTKLPIVNGTYVTTFNDGSGLTGYYEDMVLVATNGAAPGNYRLGILNSTNTTPTTAVTAKMFPMDLVPGTSYIVVTSVALTNGFSTLWVNPGDQSSPSVSDTTQTVPLVNLADFELRESGANAGIVNISRLKVGTTFDSVFPSLHVQPIGTNAVLNWSDPTLGVQSATNVTGPYVDLSGATPPYTNNASTNNTMFFRFKE
jgi:hypothetical protein